MKNITSSKAIRFRCLDCSHYVHSEARNCPLTECPLFHYRRGKRPPAGTEIQPPCKAIREFCLECQGDSDINVMKCPDYKCALYTFRLGKNPNFKKTTGQRENSIKNLGIALTLSECQEPHQSPSEIKVSPENQYFSRKE